MSEAEPEESDAHLVTYSELSRKLPHSEVGSTTKRQGGERKESAQEGSSDGTLPPSQ